MPTLSVATHANLPQFRPIAEVIIGDHLEKTTALTDRQQKDATLADRQRMTVTLRDYVPDEE